jgi:hypothetical protein
MPRNDHCIRGEQPRLSSYSLQDTMELPYSIRRIQQYQTVAPGQGWKCPDCIGLTDLPNRPKPDAGQIFADDGALPPVALDEIGPRGTPAQRLDAEAAGARKQIQHSLVAILFVVQNVKDCRSDTLGGGPHTRNYRPFQASSTSLTTTYTHDSNK